jgi:RNA polymerase sigma factor for flagellar operon FliA
LRVAEKVAAKSFAGTAAEDLVADGCVGMLDAIERFEPARGLKFETFALLRVRGAMLDSLRRTGDVARNAITKSARLQAASRDLAHRLGYQPTIDEAAEEAGLSRRGLWSVTAAEHRFAIASLNATMETDAGYSRQLWQETADRRAPSPTARAEADEFWRRVLRGFSKTERLCVLLYWRDRQTMKKIAAELDLSESRVSQMMSALTPRLRANYLKGQAPEREEAAA